MAIIVVLLYILGEVLLVWRRLGAALYATGSNREAAFVAGIPVASVQLLAYMFCGFMAALAGLVVAARISSGDSLVSTTFTLASITAVVVVGPSIFGGRATLLGTLLGSVLVIMLQNALPSIDNDIG